LDLKGRKTDHGKKLRNDELHSLYCSGNIVRVIKSRRMRWAGHVARIGGGEGCLECFGWEARRKRPLGIPRSRWEDNIKIDLREIVIDGTNWIQLDQDRVQWRAFASTVRNLRVP
jgi:hypothetical protein